MFNKNQQKNKGFTILFAVLVSSLILSIGASIISVALKQMTLSGSARDSQYAFYAANTGTECALYWDFKGVAGAPPVFATSPDSVIPDTNNTAFNAVTCNDIRIIDGDSANCTELSESNTWCVDTGLGAGGVTPEGVTKFRIKNIGGNELDYCADVSVKKEYDSVQDRIVTIIESRGYNTCDENNPRRIERGLRYRY